MNLLLAKRIILGLVVGGLLGLGYQKLVGCTTGTCPLTATPWRTMIYGGVMGLIWAFSK